MKVYYTRAFRKDFQDLPKERRHQAEKQLRLFVGNPRHPSLRVRRIQGSRRSIWEGRVSRSYRFTFEWEGETVVLRRIGPHAIIDQEAKD